MVLHHGHGVGIAELAGAFTLREGAVRTRLCRATEKLRASLHDDSAAPRWDERRDPRRTRAAPVRIPEGLGQPATRSPLYETLSADSRRRLEALAETC